MKLLGIGRPYIVWWKNKDRKVYKRIQLILNDMVLNPYEGIGKPEALRYNLTGKWSRRITKEHRLIYETANNNIIVYPCRFYC